MSLSYPSIQSAHSDLFKWLSEYGFHQFHQGKIMTLEWRSELNVGNDIIDSDHKHLFEIINQVKVSLKENRKQGLTQSLENLSKYSLIHFEREERIATAVGYTHVSSLHDSHQGLLVKLNEIKQSIETEWTPESIEQFSNLLRDWLINHVIKEDFGMKPFLAKYSPKFDPR